MSRPKLPALLCLVFIAPAFGGPPPLAIENAMYRDAR